jgi:hypothetical protein
MMRHAAVIAVYVVLAVIFTWPMATQMTTTVPDLGDPLHLSWILDWDMHALTHAPLRIFDAPMFHPAKYPLAYSENMIGVAVLCLPFHLIGLGPVAIFNIALLLGLALSAYAGHLLGWTMTHKAMPSFVAGLMFGFAAYKWGHLAHLQIIWSPCAALLLAAILAYRRNPTVRHAAYVAAALTANVLMNIYLLLFCAVTLVLSLALIAIAESHDRKFWLRLAAALAIAGIVILPILLPYWIVTHEYRFERGDDDAMNSSATPMDWLIANGRSLVYGPITDQNLRHNERELFPGMMLFALAACALLNVGRVLNPSAAAKRPPSAADALRTRPTLLLDVAIVILILTTYGAAVAERVRYKFRGTVLFEFHGTTVLATILAVLIVVRFSGKLRDAIARSRFPLELWIAGAWIVIGFVGSLGLHTFFQSFLFDFVPGFRATRVPARWAMIAFAGLAAWAAAGMARVATTRWRTALVCALVLLDVAPRIRWEHALVEPSEVDLWIGSARAGPLLLLPANRDDLAYQTLLRATAHHQPMINGLSSFEPPTFAPFRAGLDASTLGILERYGCRYVVVRPEWCGFQLPVVLGWLHDGLASGHLAFVRRFDFNAGGDWLFAVTRVEKNWERYRAASQDLDRFLAGQPTRSGVTFGRLAQPTPYSETKGALDVTGLAMSPYGVRRVTALVDNGRYRFDVPLYERADYTSAYPFYPQSPRPAFALRIPQKPKGLWKYTDLQIEIVDGRGHATLLPDVAITWR